MDLRCLCPENFSGDRCEISLITIFCGEGMCVNGICIEESDGFNCFCFTGFVGERCESMAVSCRREGNPCLNGGTCVSRSEQNSNDLCLCAAGFSGVRCEVDLTFCSPSTCANSGTCIESTGVSTFCICSPGFTGSRCLDEIICTAGDVRLAGSGSHLEGRVEVCINNQWGTVCEEGWGNEDAAVVCTQLGFTNQDSLDAGNIFGSGNGQTVLSDVNCIGTEVRLVDCPISQSEESESCMRNQDVGVICQPLIYEVALMNSIRISADNIIFGSQTSTTMFINNMKIGFITAFFEYCFNLYQLSISTNCFEMDLSGRQGSTPLEIQHLTNISAIMVPNSLEQDETGLVSIEMYYLVYYQEQEAVILTDTSLTILQVNRSIFSALDINVISYQQLPIVQADIRVCLGEVDSKWMIRYSNTSAGTVVFKPCPMSNSASAITRRLCMLSGEWSEVNVSACGREEFRNISESAEVIFDAADVDPVAVEMLLTDLTVATTPSFISQYPRDLDTTNDILEMTVDYLMTQLMSGNTVSLSTGAFDVISNVLDNTNMNGWNDFLPFEAGSERLLNYSEQYGRYFGAALMSDNISMEGTNVGNMTIVRDNIVLKADVVGPNMIDGIVFPDDAINIDLFGSVKSTLSRSFLIERGAEDISLAAVNIIFKNLDQFLPRDQFMKDTTQPGTSIISTQVVDAQGNSVSVVTPTTTANFQFTTAEFGDSKDVKNPVCGFWDFNSSHDISGTSWSVKGVETVKISMNETKKTFTVECKSIHLTSFAVLLDVNNVLTNVNPIELLALTYVTYIGCGISIFFLLCSVLFFIFIIRGELVKNVHYFVHLNLSLALLLAYTAFLAGIDTAVSNRIGCVFVAAILHYLFLAVFCWMLCEGIMLYLMLVVVFSSLSKKWWLFFMLGWGPPIIIVAISVGVIHEQYGNNGFCWISASNPKLGALWAFAAPMLAIILINVFFLLASLRSLYKVRHVKSKYQGNDLKHHKTLFKELFLATIILLPLLGLTWVFGLLSVNQQTTVFVWIFTVCNSLQGLFIFIFHVLRNEKVCGKKKRRPATTSSKSKQSTLVWKKADSTLTRTHSSVTTTQRNRSMSHVSTTSFISEMNKTVKTIDLLANESYDGLFVTPDELAGLDTKLFMTRDQENEENDSDLGSSEVNTDRKLNYTMTVNWMS